MTGTKPTPVLACIRERGRLVCMTVDGGREAMPHWPELPKRDGSHPLQTIRRWMRRGKWHEFKSVAALLNAALVAGVERLPVSIYEPRRGWFDHDVAVSRDMDVAKLTRQMTWRPVRVR